MANYTQIAQTEISRTREDGSVKTFRLTLLARDGAADNLEIPLSGEITVAMGSAGDAPHKTLKTHQLIFTLQSETDSLIDIIKEASYRQIKVKYEDITSARTLFEGYYEPDLSEYRLYEKMQKIDCRCTGQLFYTSEDAADTDLPVAAQNLHSLAERIGTNLDLPRGLDLYSALRHENQTSDANMALDISYVERTAVGGVDDADFLSAIKSVMAGLGWQVFQRNGRLVWADIYDRITNPSALPKQASDGAGGYNHSSEDVLVSLDDSDIIRGGKYTQRGHVAEMRQNITYYHRDTVEYNEITGITGKGIGFSDSNMPVSGILAEGDIASYRIAGTLNVVSDDSESATDFSWDYGQIKLHAGGDVLYFDPASEEWTPAEKFVGSSAFYAPDTTGEDPDQKNITFGTGTTYQPLPPVPEGLIGYVEIVYLYDNLVVASGTVSNDNADFSSVDGIAEFKAEAADIKKVVHQYSALSGIKARGSQILANSSYLGDIDLRAGFQSFFYEKPPGVSTRTTNWLSPAGNGTLPGVVAGRLGRCLLGDNYEFRLRIRDSRAVDLLSVIDITEGADSYRCLPLEIVYHSLAGYYDIIALQTQDALASTNDHYFFGDSGVGSRKASAGSEASGGASVGSAGGGSGGDGSSGGVSDHGSLDGLNDPAHHPWALQRDFSNADWEAPDERYSSIGEVFTKTEAKDLFLEGLKNLEDLENIPAAKDNIGLGTQDTPRFKQVQVDDPEEAFNAATKSYVDAAINGLDWQESVLEIRNSPPSSPAGGDRYLVGAAPSGDFTGHANEIAVWDGDWQFIAPDSGSALEVEDQDKYYIYNGAGWVLFGSAITHSVLQDLGADDHLQYVHTDIAREIIAVHLFKSGMDFEGDITSNPFSNWFSANPIGAQIKANGTGDFRTLYIDELIAKTFTVDVAQALAGSDILTKSVAILAKDFTVPAEGGSAAIIVEDLPGLKNFQVFEENDWVRFKVVQNQNGLLVADVYGQVSGYIDLTGGTQQWTFTVDSAGVGAGKTIWKGAVGLDYGQAGDTYIERTVLDRSGSGDFEGVPYDQIVRWVGDNPRTGTHIILTRRGNLNGLADYTTPTVGSYFAGKQGTSLTIDPANGVRILSAANSILMAVDEDSLRIGTGLHYDDNTGKLTVGSIPSEELESESGAQAKADSAQSAAEAVAVAEADLAETRAEAYADGIVTDEEQRAIAAAADDLAEAKAHAEAEAADAQAAAEAYADTLRAAVDGDVQALSDDLSDTDAYIDGAFADGIIEAAEAKAIGKLLKTVTNSANNLLAQYGEIYNNPLLGGAAKTDLGADKTNFEASRDALLTEINDAIADGKTTAAEAGAVDLAFDDFNAKTDRFADQLSIAVDYIAQAKADNAQSAAEAVAVAEAELAETTASAYADGIVTDEEQRAIAAAEDDLAEAKAHAEKYNDIQAFGDDYKVFPDVAGNNLTVDTTKAVVLTTPVNYGNHFCRISVSGYNYADGKSDIDCTITFYSNAPENIFRPHFVSKGDYPIERVRIGHNAAGDNIIILNEELTTVNSPHIYIDKAEIGNAPVPDSFRGGWAVDFIEDLSAQGYGNITEATARQIEDTGGAQAKADSAQSAAEAVAVAEAELAETTASAYADGIVTDEEQRAIAAAADDLAEAKAHAEAEAADAQAAAEDYADTLKAAVDGDVQGLSDDLSDTDTYIDGAFADGIIEAAEAKAIGKLLKTVTNSANNLLAQYGEIYNNPLLEGAAKTDLGADKTNFEASRDALLTEINDAIADGKTTAAEAGAVDLAFDDFNAKTDRFADQLSIAVDYIAQAKADLADVYEENDMTMIAHPEGGSLTADGQAGAIVIRLPRDYSNTKMSFQLHAYQYIAGNSFSINLAGYNHTSGWLDCTANIIGNKAVDNRIRFGHDGTNCVVIIGDTDSFFDDITMSVLGFQAGFANYAAADWKAGWSIFFETDLAGYTIDEDFSDNLVDAGDTRRVAGVDGSEVITQEERAKKDLAQKSGYDNYAAMEAEAEQGNTITTGGRINTDLITVDDLIAVSALIGNFLIAGSSLYSGNLAEGTLLQLLATGNPGMKLRTSDGETIVIGCNYSADNEDDVLRNDTDFQGLADRTASASVGNSPPPHTDSAETGIETQNDELPAGLGGKNIRIAGSYAININKTTAQDADGNTVSGVATGSVHMNFIVADSSGNALESYNRTVSFNGAGLHEGSIAWDIILPENYHHITIKYEASAYAATVAYEHPLGTRYAGASADATAGFSNPVAVVSAVNNFLSPLGFNFVNRNDPASTNARIAADKMTGNYTARSITLEDQNSNDTGKLFWEGGQLKVTNGTNTETITSF